MHEITIEQAALNPAALDSALRGALGDAVAGVSAALGQVRVHFIRQPTLAEATQAREIVLSHDASALSDDQRQTRTRALRQAALHRVVTAFDPDTPLNAAALEQAVRWLLLRELARSGADQ